MSKFKEGDKVRRKLGTRGAFAPFDGSEVVIVTVSDDGRWLFVEPGVHTEVDAAYYELVEPESETKDPDGPAVAECVCDEPIYCVPHSLYGSWKWVHVTTNRGIREMCAQSSAAPKPGTVKQ